MLLTFFRLERVLCRGVYPHGGYVSRTSIDFYQHGLRLLSLFSSLSTSSLELSDTTVYEPSIRALLGPASQFCEAVVLRSRTLPNGTTLSLRVLRKNRRGAQNPHSCQGEGGYQSKGFHARVGEPHLMARFAF